MARLVVAAFALAISLLVVEATLRATGHRPWTHAVAASPEPTLHDPDPVLGWWLRPGHWRYGPYAPGGPPVEVTIDADRTRRTRPDAVAPEDARSQVLTLGCSFTFGWAVSDDETWPWRLQALRPDLDVRNRGTAAYGTFQSLLLLERVLARGDRPAHVIYAYLPYHRERNVAQAEWLFYLAAFATHDIVAVPYCTLDGEQRLVRHPPRSYPAWPLHERSAAVAFLEWQSALFSARPRVAQAAEVTRRLVAEMADLCRAHGIRFSLLALLVEDADMDTVVPFARARGIDVIDCARRLGPNDIVRGEHHPNGVAQGAWGTCVAAALGGEQRADSAARP